MPCGSASHPKALHKARRCHLSGKTLAIPCNPGHVLIGPVCLLGTPYSDECPFRSEDRCVVVCALCVLRLPV